MKILLTGATGYIGKRLLSVLVNEGHSIVCCVRDSKRLDISIFPISQVCVIEVDFLNKDSLKNIPKDIDVAYYLIHSMSASIDDFEHLETESALNFREALEKTKVQQVVYLSGIVNGENLSKHLLSRKSVETILTKASFHLTTLRAGIVVGSGSASFEIIRDIVEKLPFMIAPLWLNTKSQPIAIRNVIEFLKGGLLKSETYGQSYDIGGPEVLTYKELLLQFASARNLKRTIVIVPVMTPKLSSYWLYFITSTTYKLAVNLVHSMKVEVICKPNNLSKLLNINLISYRQAIQQAFDKIEQQEVLSSWTDALSNETLEKGISKFINVPKFGCFNDFKKIKVADEKLVLKRIWSIGGKNGWYYADWLWTMRGFLDKLFGGVGLRRGRKNAFELNAGEALDFWRVLLADKDEKRLLLYAEMKLPGEAWLEFQIKDGYLFQTATFRPLGLWGRLYWYSVLPFHYFIFNGMIRRIANN